MTILDPAVADRACATSVCLAMGTVNTLTVFHPDARALIRAAFSRMQALEARLTVYRDDSEIACINQAAGEHPVTVSEDVYRLIDRAVEVSAQPGSGFDLTIGPLVNLWRIGSGTSRRPDSQEITAALALVDARAVELDPDRRTVFLARPGMRLDLGAIAKGYIADQMRDLLRSRGVTAAVIDLGGNVVAMGRCPGRPDGYWRVGVQSPFSPRGACLGALRVADASVVTSGTYERFIDVGGTRYHHLLDPRTGFPFDNDLAAVTIVSASSLTGDAWSTLAFAAGLDEGLAAVSRSAETQGLFVTHDRQITISENLASRFDRFDDGLGQGPYPCQQLSN